MNQTTTTTKTGMTGFQLGSEIIGTPVYNTKSEELGSINQLVVDTQKGFVRFATVGIGGFLGLGETEVIVPWGAFQMRPGKNADEFFYLLNVTREQLEKAPRFDRDQLDQFYAPEMSEPIFRHYNVTFTK